LGGSRISHAPLGFAGAKPRLAPALVGRLLANAMRVRRSCCCSRVGAAAAAASSPASYYNQKTKVFKGSSAMPHLIS